MEREGQPGEKRPQVFVDRPDRASNAGVVSQVRQLMTLAAASVNAMGCQANSRSFSRGVGQQT